MNSTSQNKDWCQAIRKCREMSKSEMEDTSGLSTTLDTIYEENIGPQNFMKELQDLLKKYNAELYVDIDSNSISIKADLQEISSEGHIIREAAIVDLGA